MGELHPFVPVVIFVLIEMLVDQHPQARPQLARKQHDQQQYRGTEQEYGLYQRAPFTTYGAQVIAHDGHQQKVDTGADQGGSVVDHLA